MMQSLTFASAAAGGVGWSDPASVLQAVFDAVQTGEYSALAGLCDPLGENDDDTARLCGITADYPDLDGFKAYFAKAEVVGEAVIDGDRAEVSFVFGPEGHTAQETMTLILRGDKWYLLEY